MSKSITGSYLMDQLAVALPMHYVGGLASLMNEAEGWGVASQVVDNRPTGKIVVICDHQEALTEFKKLAEAAGHTVEKAGPRNTVLVWPAMR